MAEITKISDLLRRQAQALPDKVQENPVALTPTQTSLGLQTSQSVVSNWAGTGAQLIAGQMTLSDIVKCEDIPTLADVNRVHGNKTSLKIISTHLITVAHFAGIALTEEQGEQTALVILSGYYYLNLAELALFFHRLKCGELGQVVWGQKINNQAIMCALHDFAAERRQKIDRIEAEKAQAESLERRAKDYAGAVIGGIEGHYKRCREDFEYFCQAFPILLGGEHARAWWEHFKKDQNKAISDLFNLKTIKDTQTE